jgi:beta-aspartyl-peptidase (threonine type)
MTVPYVLALHGGAGTIERGRDDGPYREGLRAALAAGEAVLAGGGSALDAVVETVMSLEDCPLFNAGRGAVFNADGEHELDAAVMDGRTLAVGAVAAVRRVRHPVQAAREVLRDGRSVLLAAAGADRFAAARGLEQVEPAWYATPERRAQWQQLRARDPRAQRLDHDAAAAAPNGARHGTVGAVARDRDGHLAAATSTGGMTNKMAGRVGDSPVIGAGTYANDASCAVSATGTGEHFIRACAAHELHARLRYARQPFADAAWATLREGVASIGGSGGLIAIDAAGEIALPFVSAGMYRAWAREGGERGVAVFEA